MKKVLVTGNATCGNRGDAAILRGLVYELRRVYPDLELHITSRKPEGSSYLFGEPLESDILYDLNNLSGSGLRRLKGKVFRNIRYDYLYYSVSNSVFRHIFGIPRSYRAGIEFLKQFDAVIHVGGSFFIDLYGKNQYEWLMVARYVDVPVYLVGHSLGPFETKGPNRMASFLFPGVKKIYLRELASKPYLDTLKGRLDNVEVGADTAWLLPESTPSGIADAEMIHIKDPIIAITVRNLAPFDVRLGVSQEDYEGLMVTLVNEYNHRGYHVVCLSMCTGLDGYVKDDRIVGYRIQQRLDDSDRMTVLMHEYNDTELGYILQRCKLLIGTRLHSVILSLRYRTPAIAIYYEHKSLGVLEKLGLGEWSFYINDIQGKGIRETIDYILANGDSVRKKVDQAVQLEIEVGQKMIRNLFSE
ncbi:polysaccharide pyruvyl transferase family protein [Lewinella sp. JB7]|uniref:polysaccharide pyruvyl transferase family protein n=1 Tax=Lewinella sp. JB7 TaxID=2962887 RepID=UPI0020C970F8|nr:polysaccharide pyruvyl transferase family protein [Lewinella sp. JB7]MCP9236779.1 polysaccharide pyruvyl transferase family protein [Lewinella sp. JB7]